MSTTNGQETVNCPYGQQVTSTAAPNGYYVVPVSINDNFTWGQGTAAGQYDILVYKTLALVASTAQTLTFNSIADVAGTTRVPLRMRELWVRNNEVLLANVLLVGPGASNALPAFGGAQTVFPGGGWVRLILDRTSVGGGVGNVVTASLNSVKFDPGAITFANTVDVVALCCSAVS